MKLPIFQVDAFTTKLFSGNPAAVCPLKKWLPESVLQNIAAENNLAETAFFVRKNHHFEIRWFTPVCEVALCGHATLAAAHVLFRHLHYKKEKIIFYSESGKLFVSRAGEIINLNFPADSIKPFSMTKKIVDAIKLKPVESYLGKTDLMLVYKTQLEIEKLNPDFRKLAEIDVRGIICTSIGEKVDFVSRFFAPQFGIDEDPVTGSSHTCLVPYWSEKLNKKKLIAQQLSKRGGELVCSQDGDRVIIGGRAVSYLTGKISVNG